MTASIETVSLEDLPGQARNRPHSPARRLLRLFSDPLASRGAVAMLDQAIVSATSFVTSVIIGRLCSRDDLGLYYLALSAVLIARGIQDQMIFSPYVVYCHRYQGRRRASYTGSVLIHQAAFSVLAMMAVAGLAILLRPGLGQAPVAPVFWILVPVIPWLLLRECVRQLSFAQLRPDAALLLDIVVCALQVGGLLVLAAIDRLSAQSAYGIMACASAAAAAAWLMSRRRFPLRVLPGRLLPDWRQNWRLARWALAAMLVGLVSPHIAPWLLAHCYGTWKTGLLAAAATLVGPAQVFQTGLANYLSPQLAAAFARGGPSELSRVLVKAVALQGLGVGAIAGCLAALGGPLLVFIYGPEYINGGLVVAALAATVLANALGGLAGGGLWAMERPQANFAADVVMTFVTLAAALLLVPSLAARGAALAVLAGAVAGTVCRAMTLAKALASHNHLPSSDLPGHGAI